jgi:hypothetical protein
MVEEAILPRGYNDGMLTAYSALLHACRRRNQICHFELLHQEPQRTADRSWWQIGAAAKG